MNLLIVEDDIHTVDAIMSSLAWISIGIDEIAIAYNIKQAKRILNNKRIDIIVSDIEMPQGSGLDLLEWVRREGMDSEFILLTCHEKFDYAASAIKFGVTEYLTKPYDPSILELTIRKTITKITDYRHLKESSKYEEWVLKNLQHEQLYFWLRLYSGIMAKDQEWIRSEIEARKLPIKIDTKFILVMTRITDYEQNLEDFEKEMLILNLEDIHVEIICRQDTNISVVHMNGEDCFWLLATIEDQDAVDVEQRCKKMVALCSEKYQVKATCCLGTPCNIEALYNKARHLQRLIQESVLYYGLSFTEDQSLMAFSEESQILDIRKISELLKQQDRVELLNHIKKMLQRMTDNRTLNEHCLYLMKQEILQATYSYLLRVGIEATKLFCDETSVKFFNKASQSALDTLRWANYLFERSFAYEEEITKTSTLIQRIHKYIHEHYHEDIGRNDLAEVFYLSPEYLGKLYHKKTGKYLQEYVRQYRIERAKDLLRNPDVLIGDVAYAVGISNFPYFSTLFKKYTGLTPSKYQQKFQK